MDKNKDIASLIEKKRAELLSLAGKRRGFDEVIVQKSQELDKLLNEFDKIKKGKKAQ
ncbi:MAG: Spo0E family sporulation regulatory protein-aspartic acid phosphatase [Halanaerobiales bacterium]